MAEAPVARVDYEEVAVLTAVATTVIFCFAAISAFKFLGPFSLYHQQAGLIEFWRFFLTYPDGPLRFCADAPWRAAVTICGPIFLSMGAAAATAITMAKPTRGEIHHQGGQLRVGAAAAKSATAGEAKRSPVDLLIAGVRITRDRLRRSVLILGSPGGGKTQLIWHMLFPAAKAGYRMLIVDGPKGDYSSCLPTDNMQIVAPWHNGAAWDVAADCWTRNHARELARALIPVSEKDPLWGNAAGMIFVACVCKLQAEHGKAWGWGELLDLIMLPLDQLKEIAQAYYPPAVQAVADAESKTTQSIAINLTAYMQDAYEMALAWRDAKERFSFCDWWRGGTGPQFVLLQGSGEFSSLACGYIAAVIRMLAQLTASPSLPDSPDRKNLLIVDELAQLPKLEFIGKFMEIGRSKGCPCILATQTPAQLRKIYGEDDLQAWMSMAGTRLYVRTSGAADLNFVARELGEKQIYVPVTTSTKSDQGESVSQSFVHETQPVVTADFIEQLGPTPKLTIRFLLQGLGANPIALSVPILTKLKPRRPAFVENPRFNAPVVRRSADPAPADADRAGGDQLPPPQTTPPAPVSISAHQSAPAPANATADADDLAAFFGVGPEATPSAQEAGQHPIQEPGLDLVLAELESLGSTKTVQPRTV